MSSLNVNVTTNSMPIVQTDVQKIEPKVKSDPRESVIEAEVKTSKQDLTQAKVQEYTEKTSKLIQDAVRLASAKQGKIGNNAELKQIDMQESKDITNAKKAVNIAIEKCQTAMTSLSTIKVSDFGDVFDVDNGKNVDKLFESVKEKHLPQNKAYKTLREAIQGQTQYLDGLRQLAKVSGNTPALSKAILQAELKHSEMSNFVAQMIAKKSEMQGLVIENLASLNAETKGHIGLIQNLFQKELTDVFTALDSIPRTADPKEFASQIDSINSKVDSLKDKIVSVNENISEGGIYTAKEGEKTINFGLNKEILNAINLSLEGAKQRVNSLKNPDYQSTKLNFIENMIMPEFDLAKFKLTNLQKGHVSNFIEKSNIIRKEVMEKFHNGTLTPELLSKLVSSLEDDASYAMANINHIKSIYNNRNFQNMIQEYESKIKFCVDTIKNNPSNVEEYKLLLCNTQDQHIKSEYIKFAFDHNLDLNSIVDAAIRGIPPEDIETLVSVNAIINKKNIGQGSINTVTKCACLDANGYTKELVFKPEGIARQGLRNLLSYSLGYSDTASVTRLNILSKYGASLIGDSSLIASSKAGSLDGKFGFFMELAGGVTPASIANDSKKVIFTAEDGTNVNSGNIKSYLKSNGKLLEVQNSLKLELCKLEWADAIAGQTDRHEDNYFVNINPESGKVQVTGIDNDSSFANAIMGIGRIDITKISKNNARNLMNQVRDDITDYRNTIISSVTSKKAKINAQEQLTLLLNNVTLEKSNYILKDTFDVTGLGDSYSHFFGLNSCHTKPEFIDRKTFDSLTSISIDDYRSKLVEKSLPQNMIEPAITRLINCQEHARSLEASGLIIEDNYEGKEKLKGLGGAYFGYTADFLNLN